MPVKPFLQILDEVNEKLTVEEAAALPEVKNIALPHLPVVILIDASSSMNKDGSIGKVVRALRSFFDDIALAKTDFYRKLKRESDFAVISYSNDHINVIVPWKSAENVNSSDLPPINADGNTPMGAAIIEAGNFMFDRYLSYKRTSTRAYCGFVFNLTDGEPTDMDSVSPDPQQMKTWVDAQRTVAELEQKGTNPLILYIHFVTTLQSLEKMKAFAGDKPLWKAIGESAALDRVNLLSTPYPFEKFVRFIESSLMAVQSTIPTS